MHSNSDFLTYEWIRLLKGSGPNLTIVMIMLSAKVQKDLLSFCEYIPTFIAYEDLSIYPNLTCIIFVFI